MRADTNETILPAPQPGMKSHNTTRTTNSEPTPTCHFCIRWIFTRLPPQSIFPIREIAFAEVMKLISSDSDFS